MSAPSFRFDDGDALIVDGANMAIVEKTRETITLRPIGAADSKLLLTNAQFFDLYRARRVTIIRTGAANAQEKDQKLAAILRRQVDSFPEKYQQEMLRRLEYVEACDKFFPIFAEWLKTRRASSEWMRKRGGSSTKGLRKYSRRFCKRPGTGHGFHTIALMVARIRRGREARRDNSKLADLEPVSGSTLRDWYKRWKDSGREPLALMPRHHLQGPTAARLDQRVLDVIAATVRRRWLTPERPPVSIVHQLICAELAERRTADHPLPDPSLATVHRWIRDHVSQYERVKERFSAKEARAKFTHGGQAPDVETPLEVVEIDHTPLDLFLVVVDEAKADKDLKKHVRRPWLTTVLDVCTRMVVGYHIGYEAPSWISVMAALRLAIAPKDHVTPRDARNPWPAFGLPAIVKLDNAQEFHSISMKAAALALGFELRYCPPREPHLKGKVERFFGDVARDFCASLPGRVYANIEEKGGYPAKELACLTLEQARLLFAHWVVDIYHGSPNAGLGGQTPLQRWNALDIDARGRRMPPDYASLRILLALSTTRTIGPSGVKILSLFYQNHELEALCAQPGLRGRRKFDIKVDPDDMQYIYVLAPGEADAQGRRNSSWICVPCTTPWRVKDLDLLGWRRIRKELRDSGRSVEDHEALLAARRRHFARVDEWTGPRRGSRAPELEDPLREDDGEAELGETGSAVASSSSAAGYEPLEKGPGAL
jgi:putative transposase